MYLSDSCETKTTQIYSYIYTVGHGPWWLSLASCTKAVVLYLNNFKYLRMLAYHPEFLGKIEVELK